MGGKTLALALGFLGAGGVSLFWGFSLPDGLIYWTGFLLLSIGGVFSGLHALEEIERLKNIKSGQ